MIHCAECGIATSSIPEYALCRGCERAKFEAQLEQFRQLRSAAFSVRSWMLCGPACNDCTPVGSYGAGGWTGEHETGCAAMKDLKQMSDLLDHLMVPR